MIDKKTWTNVSFLDFKNQYVNDNDKKVFSQCVYDCELFWTN